MDIVSVHITRPATAPCGENLCDHVFELGASPLKLVSHVGLPMACSHLVYDLLSRETDVMPS